MEGWWIQGADKRWRRNAGRGRGGPAGLPGGHQDPVVLHGRGALREVVAELEHVEHLNKALHQRCGLVCPPREENPLDPLKELLQTLRPFAALHHIVCKGQWTGQGCCSLCLDQST